MVLTWFRMLRRSSALGSWLSSRRTDTLLGALCSALREAGPGRGALAALVLASSEDELNSDDMLSEWAGAAADGAAAGLRAAAGLLGGGAAVFAAGAGFAAGVCPPAPWPPPPASLSQSLPSIEKSGLDSATDCDGGA
jgi:hypothetical protein